MTFATVILKIGTFLFCMIATAIVLAAMIEKEDRIEKESEYLELQLENERLLNESLKKNELI